MRNITDKIIITAGKKYQFTEYDAWPFSGKKYL